MASPTPSPPDVSPSQAPASAFTPSPAATSPSLEPTLAFSPSPVDTSPLAARAVPSPSFRSHGRSKHERWCDDALESSRPDGWPSYRDIVVSSSSPTSSAASAAHGSVCALTPAQGSQVAVVAGAKPAPRIVLRHLQCSAAPLCRSDSEGWQRFESRRARRRRRRAARTPRRPVPVDLVGKCFN